MKLTAIPITARMGMRTVKSVNTDGSIIFESNIADSFAPVALNSANIVPPEILNNPSPKGNINAITIKLTAIVITFLTPIAIFLHFFLDFNKNKKKKN